MIEKINIRKTATFDEEGVEISDLKKINFIYGPNGSGKTTISNLIYDPESKNYGNCNIDWRQEDSLQTLVYNKNFRDRNFGKDKIPGVFTLGQATKDEAKIIEKKRVKLSKIKEDGIQKKNTLQKQRDFKKTIDESFREDAWDSIFKKHKTAFKEAFKGVMHKKADFIKRLLEEYDNNTSELKNFDYLKKRADTLFNEAPRTIQEIPTIEFERIVEIENNDIWKKKIVGKSDVEIAPLIQRLEINDWVNEGKNYISDDTCPFCQKQTITESFKKQLEDYFDETFLKDTSSVKGFKEEYEALTSNTINQLNQLEEKEKDDKSSKIQFEKFSAHLKTLSSQFLRNIELIEKKIKEPSRALTLTLNKEQLDSISNIIKDANKEIKAHNAIVDNYSKEYSTLVNQIWKYLIEENKSKISKYSGKSKGVQKGIDNIYSQAKKIGDDYTILDEEIKKLTKNLTSVQPSVDEINKTLKSFGFQNFKIVPSKSAPNHYQIERENGELAESTLSEGEVTFITFLYFLQLAKGSTKENEITNERILIIDDPISSLDSNILFIVSTLIKEIIKNVKQNIGNVRQIILLTHNVYFHKEASFIDGRTKECQDTHFWILRKIENISTLQDFKRSNPVQNSYELLWTELKEKNINSSVTIQNTMRRIIENYFKILGKYGDDQIINAFKNPQEREICKSLISWINEGSHTIPDDLFVELQDTTTEQYFKVFKQVFKNTGHINHYEMMMR
ncbi:AAA family ATPase [Christiangramia echinicola]|uniref:Wobble nucleotide-excising tRNase n=1 Tax=Christiangramia echinicola TaxID=279359 RepID=A0A1H1KVR2_9FLAO|nr:AAA family ATPase [Christiangramia echinicola]SDR66120.1 Wobble nucleotide-excising tRNase [Christiangramia echinicola]